MRKLKLVNARTAEQWAELIQSQWQDSVKGIMDAGLSLHNAREELEPAEFRQVWERLRFSKGTVSKLITIGTDPRLMEVSYRKLPAAWVTLYGLTRLTDEQFRHGVDAGIIHAGMEQKDVATLKPPKDKPQSTPEPPLTGRDLVEVRTFEARQQIVKSLREMTREEQLMFIELLRFQLDDLEKKSQPEAT